MLVLSRRKDEVVRITVPPSTIERQIDVMVCKSDDVKARLGFEADREVIIHRLEVHELINSKPAVSDGGESAGV